MATTTQDNRDEAMRALQERKLALEIEQLTRATDARQQRINRWKDYAAIGGLLGIFIAPIALSISTTQWFLSTRRDQQQRADRRITDAVDALSSVQPTRRLDGVLVLAGAIHEADPEHTHQALIALTTALPYENEAAIRSVILRSLSSIKEGSIPRTELDEGLQTLALASRALVEQGNLWHQRRFDEEEPLNPATVEPRAADLASAILLFLRHDAHADLTGVYLAGADLRGAHLAGMHFDGAILAFADFSRADVTNASFRDADLQDTDFRNAHAAGTDFTQTARAEEETTPPFDYVREQFTYYARLVLQPPPGMRYGEHYRIRGPRFDCADLRNADFDGHALVQMTSDHAGQFVTSEGFTFRGAQLQGASFLFVRLFSVAAGDGQPLPVNTSLQAVRSYSPNTVTSLISMPYPEFRPVRSLADFDASMRTFGEAFAGTDWRRARWNPSLRALLANAAQRVPPIHVRCS